MLATKVFTRDYDATMPQRSISAVIAAAEASPDARASTRREEKGLMRQSTPGSSRSLMIDTGIARNLSSNSPLFKKLLLNEGEVP